MTLDELRELAALPSGIPEQEAVEKLATILHPLKRANARELAGAMIARALSSGRLCVSKGSVLGEGAPRNLSRFEFEHWRSDFLAKLNRSRQALRNYAFRRRNALEFPTGSLKRREALDAIRTEYWRLVRQEANVDHLIEAVSVSKAGARFIGERLNRRRLREELDSLVEHHQMLVRFGKPTVGKARRRRLEQVAKAAGDLLGLLVDDEVGVEAWSMVAHNYPLYEKTIVLDTTGKDGRDPTVRFVSSRQGFLGGLKFLADEAAWRISEKGGDGNPIVPAGALLELSGSPMELLVHKVADIYERWFRSAPRDEAGATIRVGVAGGGFTSNEHDAEHQRRPDGPFTRFAVKVFEELHERDDGIKKLEASTIQSYVATRNVSRSGNF